MQPVSQLFLVFGLSIAAMLALAWVSRALARNAHPMAGPMRSTWQLLIPTLLIIYSLLAFVHLPPSSPIIKVCQTAVGIELIWIAVTAFKALFMGRRHQGVWQGRVPALFLDLVRFAVILVGSGVVIAAVWERDLSSFLATLGIGSIVLGLALQDTLGNVFAGIALVFERPFMTGDWIKVGDTIGEVIEANWRAVRLRTRELSQVVLPNSILGKERIENFSRPTLEHGIQVEIGFSYNDPPNRVKKILLDLLAQTPGVLHQPRAVVRTKSYADFSVVYEVRFFINDYQALPEIRQDFMTRVWYAARRFGLTIPYPIRTVFKTEQQPVVIPDVHADLRTHLASVALFKPLDGAELEGLAADSLVREFGAGEQIVSEGQVGDSLFVVLSGEALVYHNDAAGQRCELARLKRGDFFGEMALLTGARRAATVVAQGDMTAVEVYKQLLEPIFAKRPSLVEELAGVAERRRAEWRCPHHSQSVVPANVVTEQHNTSLVHRIRNFFGLS